MGHHWRARAGYLRLVLWAGGRVLLGGARRRAMFERFADRARRVVVLAQDEARRLNHNYIGTEHILLGLVREGDGVAARVMVWLGADMNRVASRSSSCCTDSRLRGPGRPHLPSGSAGCW